VYFESKTGNCEKKQENYVKIICDIVKKIGLLWQRIKRNEKPGTVACAVILATGTVDIGCLRW
jgi:hypothetical protein